MPIERLRRSTFDKAVLGFERLDCGLPQAVKRFDRVRITIDGTLHIQPVVGLHLPPLLHYGVWRDDNFTAVEGTIEGSTEQRTVNSAWVFYLDRACWGRAIDLEFEFQALTLRNNTLIRPPIEIDYEIIRER